MSLKEFDHYGEYKISDLADELIEETRKELGYSADMSEVDPFKRYRDLEPEEHPEKTTEGTTEGTTEKIPEKAKVVKAATTMTLGDDFDPFEDQKRPSKPSKKEKQTSKKEKSASKKEPVKKEPEKEDLFDTTETSKSKKGKRIAIIAAAVVLVLALVLGILKVTGVFSGIQKEDLVVESVDAAFTGTGVSIGDKVSYDDFSVIASYEGGGSAPLKEEKVTMDGPETYVAGTEQTFVFQSVEDETITAKVTLDIPEWTYFSMTQTEFKEAFQTKVTEAGLTMTDDYALSFEDASGAGSDQFTQVKLTGTENCDKDTLAKLNTILVSMTLSDKADTTPDQVIASLKDTPEMTVRSTRFTTDNSLWLAAEKDNTLDELASSGSEAVEESLGTDKDADSDATVDDQLTEENTGVYLHFSNPKQVTYHMSYSDGNSASDVTVLNVQGMSLDGFEANKDGTYNALVSVTYMVTGNVVDGDPYGYLKLSGTQSGSVAMTGLKKGNYYTKVFTFYSLTPGDYTVTISSAGHTYTATTTKKSSTKTTKKSSSTSQKASTQSGSATQSSDSTASTYSTNQNTEGPTSSVSSDTTESTTEIFS